MSHKSKASLEAKRTLQKGSKTFNFAAMVLDRQKLLGTRLLYTFCRVTDDAVDQAESRQSALAAIEILRTSLQQRGLNPDFDNDTHLESDSNLRRAIKAWREVEWLFDIPREYALELIKGAEMDALGFRPRTSDDLLLYCYRVAGVVGLMMCYVLGVENRQALRSAVDMGSAMQLTNIARDLREDFYMGRSYVPGDWDLWGTSTDNSVLIEADAFAAAQQLVAMAKVLYRSGREGLYALPFRARLAVAIASQLYERIGLKIVKRGPSAIRSRMVVSFPEKLAVGFQALVEVLWVTLRHTLRPAVSQQPLVEQIGIYNAEQACASQKARLAGLVRSVTSDQLNASQETLEQNRAMQPSAND